MNPRQMVDKEIVRAGYDEVAGTYAEQRTEDTAVTDVFAAFLGSLPGGARLLDAGCGQGTPVLDRLDAGATRIGVDLSRGQLRRARENAPDASLAQGDMTRLPFASGSFDAVTALYSLIHVPEGDHQTAVDEFARVLGPGGRLLVVEGANEWSGTNPDWLEAGAEMQWHIAGPAATREHLRSAGFEIVEERAVGSAMENEDAAWQLFEGRRR